jgi:hypothetical protein
MGAFPVVSRRQIRRAFGPEALDTIERQGAAIEQLARATGQDFERVGNSLQALETAINAIKPTQGVLTRPFLGRLRWLVTGR